MDYYNTSIKPIIEFKITVICDTVTLLIYIKNWVNKLFTQFQELFILKINNPFPFPKLRIQPCSKSSRFSTTSDPRFACCLVPIP